MNHWQSIFDRLPLMPESRKPLELLANLNWWSPPANLLPLVARPQLAQELTELWRFARSHKVALVPLGSASFYYVGRLPAWAEAVLLVQPGWTAVWGGADKANLTAWLPAGLKVDEAEILLNEQRLTLSLWPEDGGTLGGNWVLPRGSFAMREYLAPSARRLGVEVLLPHGEWLTSREVPRSAAGPNVARFMAGFGGGVGLVTRVRLAVQPQGQLVCGRAPIKNLAATFAELRRLACEDYLPTSCSLWSSNGESWLDWRQNLNSGWAERSWRQAIAAFGLETLSQGQALPVAGRVPQRKTWRTLLNEVAENKAAINAMYLTGPSPEGMYALVERPQPISTRWQSWLSLAAGALTPPE